MIISFGGAQGSGKSTIAQMLADKLHWPRYYMGGLRREAAQKKGLTLAQYNKLGETDISTDQEVDEYQKKLAVEKDNFIIEGRTSWYFIPQSLKIYLDVGLDEGASRIFNNLQEKNRLNEDKNLTNLAAVKTSIQNRLVSDHKRYQKYYGIDIYDLKHYDFYLDTTNLTLQEVFDRVYGWIILQLDNIKK